MKKASSSVFKPCNKLISERIELVRKKRGLKAPGDVLLQAALRSVTSNDFRTAHEDIAQLLKIIPSIEPDERAILTNIEARLTKRDRFKVVSLIFHFLSWAISLIFKLMSKTPTDYKLLDTSPDYID